MLEILKKQKLDAIYLSKPENIQYHTGFKGSFSVAILNTNKVELITDSRYQEQAKKLCFKHVKITIITDSLEDTLKESTQKLKNIGFEANHLNYNQTLNLRRIFKGKKLIPLNKEVDQLRTIKSSPELRIIKQSQQLNEQTLSLILPKLKAGITEAEIAWEIEKTARTLGANNLAFPPIVAFGVNSASPHHSPSNKKLQKGEMILIDMGVKYEDYCSDMTRTFFTKPPTKEQATVYQTVLNAQQNCIKNLKPGITGLEGDKLARDIIINSGYGELFTHANGHGLGLEIHESPSLSPKTKHSDRLLTLQEQMAITVEPGIYLPDKFGVRIEDIVVITKDGCRNLTTFPKKIEEMIIKV